MAEADHSGRTRLSVLRGESPLLFRRTGPRAAGPALAEDGPGGVDLGVTVHLVGGAAGPLRGDELSLEVEVGAGAHLTVRSVAATLLLPGRPAPPSRLVIRARVGPGGVLRWLPEPVIAAAGCDHHAITEVDAAESATLLWRDDLVCGRHDEPSGAVRADTTIRYGGRTLYRHRLSVGPAAPGWSGAAVLGSARAIGSAILAGPELPDPGLPGPDAAVMKLAGPGLLATATAADIRGVQAILDPFCATSATPRVPAATT